MAGRAVKADAGNKFLRCIRAPIRVLGKARDFYVKSMTNCATNMGNSFYPSTLPRSFSVASSRASEEEDLRVMMKLVSQRSQREKELAARLGQPSQGLPKSFSVGIGRIDEDKPCYFEDGLRANPEVLYPRSRSYAVSKSRAARPPRARRPLMP